MIHLVYLITRYVINTQTVAVCPGRFLLHKDGASIALPSFIVAYLDMNIVYRIPSSVYRDTDAPV